MQFSLRITVIQVVVIVVAIVVIVDGFGGYYSLRNHSNNNLIPASQRSSTYGDRQVKRVIIESYWGLVFNSCNAIFISISKQFPKTRRRKNWQVEPYRYHHLLPELTFQLPRSFHDKILKSETPTIDNHRKNRSLSSATVTNDDRRGEELPSGNYSSNVEQSPPSVITFQSSKKKGQKVTINNRPWNQENVTIEALNNGNDTNLSNSTKSVGNDYVNAVDNGAWNNEKVAVEGPINGNDTNLSNSTNSIENDNSLPIISQSYNGQKIPKLSSKNNSELWKNSTGTEIESLIIPPNSSVSGANVSSEQEDDAVRNEAGDQPKSEDPGKTNAKATESVLQNGAIHDNFEKENIDVMKNNKIGEEIESKEVDASTQDLQHEITIEERKVKIIIIGGVLILLSMMIFTAWQMSDHPDGVFANACRFVISAIGMILYILFTPCRKHHHIIGGIHMHQPYGHVPLPTKEFGYNDPALEIS